MSHWIVAFEDPDRILISLMRHDPSSEHVWNVRRAMESSVKVSTAGNVQSKYLPGLSSASS